MSELTPHLNGDLAEIGSDLSRAIRRDHHRRLRRRAVVRTAAVVIVAVCALFSAAIAGAGLAGVIDLGGGHRASLVATVPDPGDRNLPYRYQVDGVHNHDGSSGTIYIESSQPLTKLTRKQIVATRTACATRTLHLGVATVWIFDASCTVTTP
jgi:hypothetical protein